MTDSILVKRVTVLEREVRSLKSLVQGKMKNKLSPGVIEGLRDLAEGRIEGPFNTADEFMAGLR